MKIIGFVCLVSFLVLVGSSLVYVRLIAEIDSPRYCNGMVINNRGKGIADVVVFLVEESSDLRKSRQALLPPQRTTLATSGFPAELVVVAKFQELVVDVSGNTGHWIQDIRDSSTSPNIDGQTQSFKFGYVGSTKLICSVHSDEVLNVFVTPSQVFSKTEKDGKFQLKGIPSGEFQLKYWHPSFGYL